MSSLIRVLVVDDSAFVRKVVTQMLSRSPFIDVVGTARDGDEALEMAARLDPDVVTLDLVMPGVDGLEFLRRQMAVRRVPVVVCSISHESGAAALEAFELGAVEFIQKPTALATDRVYETPTSSWRRSRRRQPLGLRCSRIAPRRSSPRRPSPGPKPRPRLSRPRTSTWW